MTPYNTRSEGYRLEMTMIAFILKIVGGITQLFSIVYIIVAAVRRKGKHVLIGIVLLIIAGTLLFMSTKIQDDILRYGYDDGNAYAAMLQANSMASGE
ncbi:hypothetical protein GCM10007362_51690 [Saccharibacillus endophyticus]|uniref:DUF4064 domain-containing protein n=2 Tax=Saccharibacillus endophyticus TaxID=2060666 RepID=A0ABQ2AB22_9BACL|nr:hypothetical protein GCM10007362_51690 [Saccharibacillus endophyticus]